MGTMVTGGGGFIGQAVLDELLERGETPISLDWRAKPDIVRRHLEAGVEQIIGDVRDHSAVRATAELSTGIIHLAGQLGTQETVEHPRRAVEVNMLGTLNVLETARELELPLVVITVGNHWMRNPYAITKFAGEQLTNMAAVEWPLAAGAVRALNAYGPEQSFGPVLKIIPTMVRQGLLDQRITVYGDGEQRMDMVHVDDVAIGLVNALTILTASNARLLWAAGETLELGTGVAPTVGQIADTIADVLEGLGKPRPDICNVPMRPGEEPGATVVANPDLVHPLLEDPVPLTEGLGNVVARLVDRLEESDDGIAHAGGTITN